MFALAEPRRAVAKVKTTLAARRSPLAASLIVDR
jgi:hypothetical protein